MNRLTKAQNNNFYLVDDTEIQHDTNGYYGDAVTKLAKFENIYEDLMAKQKEISGELEKLRLEGKTKSVKFKQLLANKLNNSQILALFESYDLE